MGDDADGDADADAEERLKRQRNDLRPLNQVMRHDIRNDPQLIGAYAELPEEHVDEEGAAYLDVIRENTRSAVDVTGVDPAIAGAVASFTPPRTPSRRS
jgi:light-regulated signal transduction histidine kinase (bacteriophytochrome)